MAIASINPFTGETEATFAPLSAPELEARLTRAAAAFNHWRRTPVDARADVVRRAGRLLESEQDAFGRLMTREMGKTIAAARAEAAKCAAACAYYAEHGASFIAPDTIASDPASGDRGEVRFQPLGAILAVMPWNFPFWQVIRFAAPALVAGNVALLKHASNVPQCALALEDLFARSGAPEGVFQSLLIGSDAVDRLIADPRVAAVTLTGSEGAGRSVATAAGQQLKKTVLELGGSDPFVVLPSADIATAARTAVTARTINNGQSCIAAKRFIVVGSAGDEFTERFVAGMRSLRVGDPMDEQTELGPLATAAIRDELHQQVRASVASGARVLTGGHPLDGAGNFYAPTVLTDIPRGAPAWGEELFGPVASLFRARDLGEAIAIANDSRFGLAASVWTTLPDEAERFAEELEVGTVFVNGMVASDPRFPFGGVKASGHGRELGVWGLREFVNIKTVRQMHAGSDGAVTLSE